MLADACCAGEKRQSTERLFWRPYRPSRQSDVTTERIPKKTQAAIAMSARTKTSTPRRDRQVERAALELSDDPLANPFSDPLPRSPFRPSARQAAPADSEELPVATQDQTGGGAAEQSTPPNPFETQPTAPEANSAPQALPNNAPAPGLGGSGPLPSYSPLAPPNRLPDPKENCEEARIRLKSNTLNQKRSREIVELAPQEPGELPYACTFLGETRLLDSGRDWASICYTWKASGLCHKPLYFEQAHMERYGHSYGPVLDSVISGAHFFATVPVLPYKMGLEPPLECVYPLGEYRPGSCAPRYIEPVPFSVRAAAAEAATVTGLSFALP
jgi:hypothetical protein